MAQILKTLCNAKNERKFAKCDGIKMLFKGIATAIKTVGT